MPRFKSFNFDQHRPKLRSFLQISTKFSSAGGSAPSPLNSPTIADFWLHACDEIMQYAVTFILQWLTNAIITILTPVFVISIAILGAGPSVATLRMVTPGAEFRGVTLYNVL